MCEGGLEEKDCWLRIIMNLWCVIACTTIRDAISLTSPLNPRLEGCVPYESIHAFSGHLQDAGGYLPGARLSRRH